MKFLKSRAFRLIVILICIAIIIYESICLYHENKEYDIADVEYEELVEETVTIAPVEEMPEGATYPPLYIRYSQLKAINEDFVAWLYFPYFEINYPVVHETEIDEYLKKTFDGTRNSSGCLFTDILSSTDFTGMHDIIFGHNMRNGSMFGKFKQLTQAEDPSIIRENPYIYIYTEKAVFKYEIFSFYVTTVGSDAYSVVTSQQEYDDFINFATSSSIYKMPDDLSLADYPSVLTLSTCSGRSGSGRRFVIHAAKVETWNLE